MNAERSQSLDRRSKRVERTCMWCGGIAAVRVPLGYDEREDELNADAEFSSAGRAFGYEDDVHGFGCYRCSRRRWAIGRALENA